jgi:hypothetical protein
VGYEISTHCCHQIDQFASSLCRQYLPTMRAKAVAHYALLIDFRSPLVPFFLSHFR